MEMKQCMFFIPFILLYIATAEHEIGLVLFEYRFSLNSSFSLFAVVSNFNFEPAAEREKKQYINGKTTPVPESFE